jgi:hypothetical protein
MKRLVLSLVLLAVIVGGVGDYYLSTRTAPSISVYLVDDTGGGGGPGLPEIDGYMNGDFGTAGNYTAAGTYKVVANTAGKFFVLAHYHVDRAGVSTEFDRALPVLDQKPEASKWVRLDSHLESCAFLSGGTINY